MADYMPLHLPGEAVTLAANAAITGGQALVVSGSMTVAPSSGSSIAVVGHAAFDAASGADVTVYARGTVHEATASGAITAGARVVAAADGAVATSTGHLNDIGIALSTAADNKVIYMEC